MIITDCVTPLPEPKERVICISPDLLLELLSEVGKARALSDKETDMIQDCIALEQTPFRWNPRLDVALVAAAHSMGGIKRFAIRHGITENMTYVRLHRLRRKEKG